jgi:hypothetical protein
MVASKSSFYSAEMRIAFKWVDLLKTGQRIS